MLSDKQKTVILFLMILSGLLIVVFYYGYSFPIIKNHIVWQKTDWFGYNLYLLHNVKFDYFFGLWLTPSVTLFMLFLFFIGFPMYDKIFKRFKQDFIKKKEEIKTFRIRL
jgi:hypothetical protein